MNLEKKFDIGLVNVNIEPLLEYKKYINSFFVGVPFISNCRSNYIYTDRLKEFIKRCEDIPVWVTMNSPIVQTHEFSILCDTAIGAYKEFGFHGYTVTNISLLSVLRDHGIPVKVSTVNDIRDLNKIPILYKDKIRYHVDNETIEEFADLYDFNDNYLQAFLKFKPKIDTTEINILFKGAERGAEVKRKEIEEFKKLL